MKASIRELERFCGQLFPREEFRVYVPPSNILSQEGRSMLSEETDIQAIASVYLPDGNGIAYVQEFEVAKDGIIETPRVISGYVLEDYMQLMAFSELNFHYVNTHFQHPDDILDEERGSQAGMGGDVPTAVGLPGMAVHFRSRIRSLTGTELAAAVQTYDELQVEREDTRQGLRLRLDGFQEEAWLMVRINEGTFGEIQEANCRSWKGIFICCTPWKMWWI